MATHRKFQNKRYSASLHFSCGQFIVNHFLVLMSFLIKKSSPLQQWINRSCFIQSSARWPLLLPLPCSLDLLTCQVPSPPTVPAGPTMHDRHAASCPKSTIGCSLFLLPAGFWMRLWFGTSVTPYQFWNLQYWIWTPFYIHWWKLEDHLSVMSKTPV